MRAVLPPARSGGHRSNAGKFLVVTLHILQSKLLDNERPDSSEERVALSGRHGCLGNWLAQVPGSTPGRVFFFSPTFEEVNASLYFYKVNWTTV
mgnify:CR=1 FL=1